MPLSRFTVQNYRCFPTEQEIELGKITVVLGQNNSGKSALVRAPLVMSTGLRRSLDPSTPSGLPLDLERLGEGAPTFRDLVHGQRPHQRIRFTMDLIDREGMSGTVKVSLQDVDEWQAQVVDRITLHKGNHSVSLRWLPNPDNPWGRIQEYEIQQGTEVTNERVRFIGLQPRSTLTFDNRKETHLPDFGGLFLGFDQIRYLGPFRTRPGRVRRLPSRAPRTVGATGEDALDILANDVVRGQGRVLRALNRILSENIPGWTVGITDHEIGMYSVHLTSTHDPSVQVSLGDAGTGVVQMLPVLVQRALDEVNRSPLGDVLEIVEEPELHLHPSAHADVADLFISAATRSRRVRFLIETHSETFLLRIRRRIAEGRLNPDDVSLYFVEHANGAGEARRIGIDRLGNLDYWPSGVFTEDFEETRALAQAQSGRLGSHAR
ncbi:AAA family ATPase [Nocardiopsis lucentensis]|uniref:AAA family ATPase n=1 Tax=Nocardiopsis lucentensis TaxID=53441 RepID=UPI00034C0C44|nr:DUF3696 domain-containing protein [Nocardiopsis lucentensis]